MVKLTAVWGVVVAVLMAWSPAPAVAAEFKLGEKGVSVGIKGASGYTLTYPSLQPGNLKPVEKKISGKEAELTYAGGIMLHVALAEGGKVNLQFSNAKDLKSFLLSMQFGQQYGEGGTWAIGKGEVQKFPAEKPAKPHLYQGNAGGFTVTDVSGRVLSVSGFPDYAYQELTDLREWGQQAWSWKVSIPHNPQWKGYTLVLSETPHSGAAATPGAKAKVLVDRFGQTTLKEFPGKLKEAAELKADATKEAEYWASYKPQAVDQWGGLPGTKEKYDLKATGFFRVEKKDGKWLLVNPDGNVTFHKGVCVFTYNPGDEATYIKDRHEIYEWIPPVEGEFAAAFHPDPYQHKDVISFYAANLIRKYGVDVTKDQQIGRMVDRVRQVGFNAVGAFSGNSPAFAEKHFPRMSSVGFNPELPGLRGIADPFDDAARAKTEESWAKSLPAKADDPLIIGYFFANEQGFEDIPRGVPQLGGKYAAKRKLVEMLQKKYPSIAEFNAAWGLKESDFAALADKGLAVTTKVAFADMQQYTEVFLEAYYRFISETFRKYDKNHLMVASRWQPGTANSEALARAAGKYMDVISINYYGWGVDRTISDRVYQWSGGKPQMWSEFFFSAGPESNAASYARDLATQKLRGQAYRQYIEHGAASGYVLGIEWFSLVDQAVTGRWFSKYNGERCNNGLFNACDRPYDDCLREMATAHADVYDVWLNGKKPFDLDDPRVKSGGSKTAREFQAGRVAPGSIKIDGMADNWPGRPPELFRSLKEQDAKGEKSLEAAFKVAWDTENLYVIVNVTDPTPLNNSNEGGKLWAGDAIELFIGSEKLDQPGALLFTDRHVLLGAQAEPKPNNTHVVNAAKQPAIPMVCVPSVDGSGYTMEAAIPWSALDVKPAENMVLLFDLAVDDAPPGGYRTRQIMWNGGANNSSDRSNWGRLRLVP